MPAPWSCLLGVHADHASHDAGQRLLAYHHAASACSRMQTVSHWALHCRRTISTARWRQCRCQRGRQSRLWPVSGRGRRSGGRARHFLSHLSRHPRAAQGFPPYSSWILKLALVNCEAVPYSIPCTPSLADRLLCCRPFRLQPGPSSSGPRWTTCSGLPASPPSAPSLGWPASSPLSPRWSPSSLRESIVPPRMWRLCLGQRAACFPCAGAAARQQAAMNLPVRRPPCPPPAPPQLQPRTIGFILQLLRGRGG